MWAMANGMDVLNFRVSFPSHFTRTTPISCEHLPFHANISHFTRAAPPSFQNHLHRHPIFNFTLRKLDFGVERHFRRLRFDIEVCVSCKLRKVFIAANESRRTFDGDKLIIEFGLVLILSSI